VVPCVEMNPILIKPSSDTGSQVVLLGRVWGQVSASDYHRRRVEELFPTVLESYRTLAERFDLILLEGAGSPAEINLREHDIVNMRMAHAADAACVLIGDIDRGGIFGALLGTLELLEPEDRARIRGFVINKFRGDAALLRPGVETMERRLGIPCVGVVPFLRRVGLEEEDGLAMEDRRTPDRAWRFPDTADRPLRIGIVALPHIANFTDFDALAMDPSVALAFLEDPGQADGADVLILPGSKQTLDDLAWLRARGFAEGLAALSGLLVGICGGFQMLGLSIEDPCGVESAGMPRTMAGLGILPVRTVMRGDKTVRRTAGIAPLAGEPRFSGYEIHMGETIYENGAAPFAEIMRDGEHQKLADGAMVPSGRAWGTYVHGIFDDDAFRHRFVDSVRASCALAPASDHICATAERQARIDRWADHLRQSLDMNLTRGWASGRDAKATGGGK
jgi:adenosylcobyric acid synthase